MQTKKPAILDDAPTFPLKRIWLIIWIITLLFALAALITAAQSESKAIYLWIVVAIAAISQIWATRWVQVDAEWIRTRNIFQRGRELRWEEITKHREEELPLRKKSFTIIYLSNAGEPPLPRPIRIKITSDIVGFEILRDLIRESVPSSSSTSS